jgi:hypothetical protein
MIRSTRKDGVQWMQPHTYQQQEPVARNPDGRKTKTRNGTGDVCPRKAKKSYIRYVIQN